MEPPSSGAEIEWQLDAQDLRPVLRWIENGVAGNGIAIAPSHPDHHVDTYLDTKDRRLDRAGYSVRIRRWRGRPSEATLKSLDAASADALRIRLELEERLDVDEPAAVGRSTGPVGERVRALVGSRELVPLFDVQTRRRVFPLTSGGAPTGELQLDETAIREPGGGGKILSRLRRVEVEVPEAAVGTVSPLVDDLRRACGLHAVVLSKYEAALVASGRARAGHAELGPTTVEPEDTMGQVGLAVLRRNFGVWLAKEPGTRLGDDPEELHDMRVAIRRLRAAVALFGDFLPVEASRLRPELAWVGKTIGAVRDLDVQLRGLEEAPEGSPLAPLRALLAEQRTLARAQMLEALDSPRYERLVRRFGAMLRSHSGTRTIRARAAAPDLVELGHDRVREATAGLGEETDPAAYHRLRIAGKRFRYALELLADVYPGETKRLVRRTVALQDLLGAYQDSHVGITRLHDLSATRGAELGPETVFAMGELAERYRSAMDGIRGKVPRAAARLDRKAWKRFQRRMGALRD